MELRTTKLSLKIHGEYFGALGDFEFSPYTHFYTQVLIDLIVKTYNSNEFRTDLLFKSQISVFIENSKYTPNEIYEQIEENQYTIELILYEWTKKKEEMTKNIVIIYIKILKKLAEKLVL